MNQKTFIKPIAGGAASDLEETYWWYLARKEVICDTAQRFLSAGSEIIDFGAGSGLIAKQLVDLGYKVVATDISTSALAACRARELNTLDLNTDWPAANSADCILACDVLEHVDDDVGLLRKLRPALRARGLLIATVPAYDFLWSGEDYVSNHVRRYTRTRLENCAGAAGFTIEWCSYFNMLLLPAIAAVVLYKRLLRPRALFASDVQPLPELLNEVLYRIFAVERNILRFLHCPAGASILLVARALS